MKHTSESLTKMIAARETQYQTHTQALKVRRGLMDRNLARNVDEVELGLKLPAPFDKSPMRIKVVTGNAAQAVNTLASAISTNFPRPKVFPVSIHHEKIGKRVKKQGAEQERLLLFLADVLGAKNKQYMVERAATWGGVGWYFTLPREAALGLPPRTYYDDYSEAEVEAARKQGIEIEEVYEADGKMRYAEAAGSWLERRKQAARENWAQAASMFMLEAYPPDMVWPTFALDGSVLRAHITMEIPADDMKPGSEFARAAGRYAKKMGEYEGDEADYGLWREGNAIKCGIPAGQEPGTVTASTAWTLTIWADREDVYYLCGAQGVQGGKIVWHDEHRGGICPIIPVPFMRTDSRQPGSEFATAADPIFRAAAPLNALWNMALAGAGWNSSPRYAETGVDRVGDPETGEQTGVGVPGADPAIQDVYAGELTQILVKIEDVVNLLDRAIAEVDKLMPSALLTGDAIGGGDTAWALQIQVGQLQQLYKQPVDHHAEAWKQIWTLWVRWMKQLGLPVVAFPSSKQGEGLIEIEPESLTEAFTVVQDSADAQMQTIRQQMGIERHEAGLIDDETLFEDFFGSDDPQADVLKARLQKLKNLILFGDTGQIQPGSALYKVYERVQGRLEQQAQATSPNAAVAAAEAALAEAQAQANQQQQAMMAQAGQGGMGGEGPSMPSMPGAPGLGGRPTTLAGQLGDAAPVAAPMV